MDLETGCNILKSSGASAGWGKAAAQPGGGAAADQKRTNPSGVTVTEAGDCTVLRDIQDWAHPGC